MGNSKNQLELSIVMPCLNEAETLGTCIKKARDFLNSTNITGEVIVADNGSTDGSQEIAANLGARLVTVETRGYGSALMSGIQAARGTYIIMGDSDDSYNFSSLMPFVEKLREGYDLVMGNRFKGGVKPGAMPFLHKYLGNPILSRIGKLFFSSGCGDFHCGLRGFKKASIIALDLQTTGMEFATEMVAKAARQKFRITEVPTILYPDGRSRPPHLRSWRDGWRHLRFMLLYSPRWLFMIPGFTMLALGFLLLFALVGGPLNMVGIQLDIHYMILGSLLALIGFQVIALGVYAMVFAFSQKFVEKSRTHDLVLKYFSLERGILLGGSIFLVGLVINLYILFVWVTGDFAFGGKPHLREAILAMTLMVIGIQIIFSSFFLSFLGIKKKSNPNLQKKIEGKL